MTDWRGQTTDSTFGVQLRESVLRDLDRLCREANGSETGGILVGYYSDSLSVAIVEEATPPPSDSSRGRSWFERGVNGLRGMLNRRWQSTKRTHYVGEWHFHPANHIEPSGDDFDRMREISNARAYDCKEPLLLIVGARHREALRSFRVFVCPAGRTPLEHLPLVDENTIEGKKC